PPLPRVAGPQAGSAIRGPVPSAVSGTHDDPAGWHDSPGPGDRARACRDALVLARRDGGRMNTSSVVEPPGRSSDPGWRRARVTPSLAEVYRTVPVSGRTWWRKALAFAGPGYLVAVGYMDPGNWATDLAGGSAYGYTLLSVVLISNFMAILLQALSAKLGIATGRDLAQAVRDHYSRPAVFLHWIGCEIAIAACDLAEVIGSAIALNLLFG